MTPAITGARRDREKGEPLRRLKVGSGSSGGGERERTGSAPALPVRFFSFSSHVSQFHPPSFRSAAQPLHRSTVPPFHRSTATSAAAYSTAAGATLSPAHSR